MRKKLLLLFTTILAGYYGLFAQNPVVDSLKNLLNAHPGEDTVRINLLNNIAQEIRRVDRTLTQPYVAEALKLSQKLHYEKGEAYATLYTAQLNWDKFNYSEGHNNFKKALKIFEKLNDKNGIALVLRHSGRMSVDEGKYIEALDDLLKSEKTAEESRNIKLAIDVKGIIGYLYNVIGEYAKAIPYYTDALNQAKQIGYTAGMAGSYNSMGKTYKTQGDYPKSLDAYQKGLVYELELKNPESISIAYGNIGDVYERMNKYPEAFSNINRFVSFYKPKQKNEDRLSWGYWLLGRAFLHSGRPDSGLFYGKQGFMLAEKVGYRLYLAELSKLTADGAAALKKWDTAYKYLSLSSHLQDSLRGAEITRKTTMLQANFDLDKKQTEIALLKKDKELQMAENRRERAFLVMVLGGLATVIVLAVILFRNNRHKQKANVLLQKQKHEIDNKAHELSIQKDELEQSYRNVELLSEIGRKITSSLSVEKIISTVYDNVNALMDASVFGIGIYNEALKRIEFPATYENGKALPFYSNSIYEENRFGALCFISGKEIIMGDLGQDYKNYVQNIPTPKEGRQAVSLIYLPLRAKERILGVITVQSFEKSAYSDHHLFMLRNIAIYAAIALENAEAFDKLNQTFNSLKKTQSQLIQAEKMASLGELTAGIAHEIQNPLNFVNNFSEVSVELAGELKENLASLNFNGKEKENISQIIDDLMQNQEKINFHGKRADAIVKGMLMHSRTSTGQKEPTDINALADEYLRLSYHGLRAKDKTFNANFKTDFDPDIKKINIIPQDIGRVILNLFTNAFYSVTEKKKQLNGEYEPTVLVTTKMIDDKVELRVKDNGIGIPKKVLDKIYQPFFTTKPGGQGTGLGLSLSYDIITKGHGGQISVDTKEGEFAEFIIQLPANPIT
ncbi:MAG TPA: ATP-binding protein [Chitinophagaceae bacterium]|nr:ATP-binding protein [Chitinophagaceae bacterium]